MTRTWISWVKKARCQARLRDSVHSECLEYLACLVCLVMERDCLEYLVCLVMERDCLEYLVCLETGQVLAHLGHLGHQVCLEWLEHQVCLASLEWLGLVRDCPECWVCLAYLAYRVCLVLALQSLVVQGLLEVLEVLERCLAMDSCLVCWVCLAYWVECRVYLAYRVCQEMDLHTVNFNHAART
jgi:hypothetical protein